MSKKINCILFVVLIIFTAMPFYEIAEGGQTSYVSGFSIFPGLDFLDMSNYYASVVRSEFQNIKYYLFFVIPIAEIALMCFSIYFEGRKNNKVSILLEVLCYVLNFIGFVFSVFSVKESYSIPNYKLSSGYFGMLFAYVIIYVVKVIEYLIAKTPPEIELWPNVSGGRKRRR